MKKLIYILLLAISYSLSAQSDYYVDANDGDDANTGLSEAQAWQTIEKVNNSTFSPGDSIHFKRGCLWREYLNTPSSGTSNNHIVFTDYGEGDKPRIFGSDVLTSFTAHESLPNVYRGDQLMNVNPDDIRSGYDAAIFFIRNDSVIWCDAQQSSLNDLDEVNEFVYQNDTIYFYYPFDISDLDSIEVEQRARCIDVTQEYITIDGFELKYAGSRCIGNNYYPETQKIGAQIRNCEIAYTAARGGGIGYGISLHHSDMIIEDNDIYQNGRRNISINITHYTSACVIENVIIRGNELHEGFHTTGIDLSLQGTVHSINDVHIYNNNIWDYYTDSPIESIDGRSLVSNSVFIENNGDSADIDSIYFYNNVVRNSLAS